MKRKPQDEITDQADILAEFAARLKSQMARKGLTLRAVGEKLGKSTSTVGAWTQGKNWPEVETLIALTDILDMPFEFLVYGVTPHRPDPDEVHDVAEEAPLGGSVEEDASDYANLRNRGAGAGNKGGTQSGEMLDPRHAPRASPSTRADCEEYFAELLDRAASGDNPNAFPSIMHRLQKQFPLDEWDPPRPPSPASP